MVTAHINGSMENGTILEHEMLVAIRNNLYLCTEIIHKTCYYINIYGYQFAGTY